MWGLSLIQSLQTFLSSSLLPHPPHLLYPATDRSRQSKKVRKKQKAKGQTPKEQPLSPLREAIFQVVTLATEGYENFQVEQFLDSFTNGKLYRFKGGRTPLHGAQGAK